MLAAPLALLTLLASAAPVDPAGAEVVAEIGDYRLTREMMDAFWNGLPAGRRAGYEKGGGKPAFLQDFIDQKLCVAEAERRGYLDRAELRAAAELARDAVLYRALVEEQVTAKIVTEAAMREWYAANHQRFAVEEMARIRVLVVTPRRDRPPRSETAGDARDETEARAKIERLRTEIVAGADFSGVARRESEDRSAAEGGLLPDFPRGRMSQAIEDAAFALPAGQVSDVLRTPEGFHLIRVEARIPAHVRPYDQVREEVRIGLGDAKKDAFRPRFAAYAAELRARNRVVVRDPALAPRPAEPPRSTP
jgi:hypothetical protein